MNDRIVQGSRPLALAGFLLAAIPPADASTDLSGDGHAPFCRVIYQGESGQALSAKPAALKGWPERTVRLIYFLPKDRPFRAEVVDSMKTAIVQIQAFFAQQMREHGHGDLTFQYETDAMGEPLVHRVDGEHDGGHYVEGGAFDEILQTSFGRGREIELLVLDQDSGLIGGAGGLAYVRVVNGQPFGTAEVPASLDWVTTVHELGHAFGLEHDFRSDDYIMSYGSDPDRVSACNAGLLTVHPFFNPDIGGAQSSAETIIDLTSSLSYEAGSSSIPVQLRVSDSTGLHQVLLFARTSPPHFAAGLLEVLACRSLSGESPAVVEFDYDGSIPSERLTSLSDPVVHPLVVRAVDQYGRRSGAIFGLHQSSPFHIVTLEEPETVTSLAFSPEGTSLATATGNHAISLWDLERREVMAELGPIPFQELSSESSVAFSPDGATLASRARDGNVRLWDVATGSMTAALEGQPGTPTSLAFSPDGATLAAVSSDNTVTLWNLETETESASLRHDTWVSDLAFSPDGATIASASSDGQIHLWDSATGAHTAALEGHEDWVGGLAFSADGATLASSGLGGLVKLWDVTTRRGVATLEHGWIVGDMAFSPDGLTLACASRRVVRLWDAASRVQIGALPHAHRVEAVAFSPDGRTFASGTTKGVELWDASEWLRPRSQELVKISGDGQQGSFDSPLEDPLVVEVLDQHGNAVAGAPVTFAVTEGHGKLSGRFTIENTTTDANGRAQIVLTLGSNPGRTIVEARVLETISVTFNAFAAETPVPPLGDGDPGRWHLPDGATLRLGSGRTVGRAPMAYSPDNQRLAVATSIGTWLYDVATAREVSLLPGAWVGSVAFSPDGLTLAAGSSHTITLWDVASGESTATLRGPNGIGFVTFSADGTILAAASRNSVRIWDAASLEQTATLEGEVHAAALSPDGTTLAAASGTTVKLWDVAAGAILGTLEDEIDIQSLTFSPDGAILATGSTRAVKLWDVTQGQTIAALQGHAERIPSVAFSPDGATLAAGSDDNGAWLWDVATWENVARFDDPAMAYAVAFSPDGGTLVSMSNQDFVLRDLATKNVALIPRPTWPVLSLAFSPDGATLAEASASTRLWDLVTGWDVSTLEYRARAVAFSPDGDVLALGGNEIRLWDVARSLSIATFDAQLSAVRSLALSPDGATLAAGYLENLVLWDVATGQGATLEGHTEEVSSVAFSPDGAILASGSRDATARVWDLETRQEVTTLQGHDGDVSVAFSPDGNTLATGSWNGTVQLWDVATWMEIATLHRHPGWIYTMAFSPDGETLAVGTRQGAVVLWDTETWMEITTLRGHPGGVHSVAFSPDGTTLATGSEDGTALLWDLSPQPHALRIVSGDGQRGGPGALLAGPLVVEVRDENGDLLEGAEVTFVITAGGGTLATETTTTDPAGRATTTLTLGSTPGPNTVDVAVEGLDPMLFTATAEATPDFDGDGEVGFDDFFLFAEAFGGSDPRFDLDASGSVDFADFFLFAESFGQPARAKLMALARERIGLPDGPLLQQNAPNPFNSQTVISWFLLSPGPARLEVFALNGQRVAVLASGDHKAGLHRLHWDGRDGHGRPLASGTYLYRLVTAEDVWARKLVLIR